MTIQFLVVDDEATIRYFLQRTLARDGYQVTLADSGEAALKCMATQEFDLALIDLKMRGMDGLELLAALRQQQPDTPVIILTAYASMETAVEALRQGAHDYLFKPCKTLDLRQSVRTGLIKREQNVQRRSLLAQLPAPSAAVPENLPRSGLQSIAPQPAVEAGFPDRFLQHRDLIVDLVRHMVTLDGKLLELSPTEYNLLAYLISEAPRVVPPEELVREVQGYESNVQEAQETMRSHIYHLRQKCRAATGRDVVHTVRGIGYTLHD